jgi:hypothetical protein
MNLDEIEKTILRWISTNYKATSEIRKHLLDDLDLSVPEDVLYAALLGLHSTGFVTSYIYDNQSRDYAIISTPHEYSIEALHWLAREGPSVTSPD